MSWRVRDGAWREVVVPEVRVGDQWVPVVRGLVYDGATAKWRRFWPDSEITQTAITAGLTPPVSVGAPRTVSGTVSAIAGSVSGGTVTVYQRAVGVADWIAVGTGSVGTGPAAPWSAQVTPVVCGASEFKAMYGGSPSSQASESPIYPVTTIVNTPAKPTGGTLGTTTASISWPAVAGATGYDVYRDSVKVSSAQAGVSFNDTGLTPNTTYSWKVVARTGTCESAASPVKTGKTGQTAARDTGSATIQVRPDKTNSYRPDTSWGYIGANVGQGYYSNSGANYTGVIDYGTKAQLQGKVEAALGANGATRFANMTVSKASVYLFKQSGIGAGAPVTVYLYNSPAIAGTGGAPARNGTVVSEASAGPSAGKWQNVGLPHWEALKAGTARSIVLYQASAANYSRFDGKDVAAGRCDLQLVCAWDYELAVAVPPAWTN